jgi:predicted P-loop ATPase
MLAGTCWLIELAEMCSVRAADREVHKAFLTYREDTYRAPYGATIAKTPRRCVFVGSTNRRDYLPHDESGYRRYWVVTCGPELFRRVPELRAERDQILAQAVHYFREFERLQAAGVNDDENDFRWWLDRDMQAIASRHAEERAQDSGSQAIVVEAVVAWWTGLPAANRPKQLTGLQVAKEALHVTDVTKLSRATETAIGVAMKQLHFAKKRPRAGDTQVTTYLASAQSEALQSIAKP